MTNKKPSAPQRVELSKQESDALKQRIKESSLSKKDINLILGLLAFVEWMQERLSRAKLSIKRLRQVFGFKSEKRNKQKKSDEDSATEDASLNESDLASDSDNESPSTETPPEDSKVNLDSSAPVNQIPTQPAWNDEQNHGRLGADDYVGCPIQEVPLDNEYLKAGQCPGCASCDTKARVYPTEPTVVVRLDSQPLVTGIRYFIKRSMALRLVML